MKIIDNEKKSKYMIIEGIVSVIVNVLLFGFKYAVGIFSGSLSIIADAWHSLSDSISSIIVIIGGIFSKKPADKEHPFGHGRIELITSFIVGIMLIFIGYTFFAEAIKNLINKQTATFNKATIIAMIVSIIIKEILAQYSFWAYRKSGAKSLYADAWHHRSDSITSIIILIGIFIGKNFWQSDAILSILVSIVIFIAAFDVIKSSVKPLIGEYPSEEIINKIKNIADELNLNGESLHHFHIHIYGAHTEITFHIRFPKNMTVFDAHNKSTIFENAIREKLSIEATIHIEAIKTLQIKLFCYNIIMSNNVEIKKLNDFFIRYFFGLQGDEDLLLSFINAIMIDSNFATFKSVEIMNPFNLSEKAGNKESIVDLKAVTEDGIIVIIEIQTYSTKNFFERTLYYWSKNYSSVLKKGEDYPELKPVISINLIDDILFNKNDKRMHTCYLLKEKNTNEILTDHIQLHYVEIPKFDIKADINKELKNWILFLKSNKEEDMSQLLKEDTIFEKAMKKYNYFTDNEYLLNEYDKREAYLVYQHSLMRDFKEEGFEEGKLEGIKEGIEKGIEEGIKERNYTIAKNLKKSGLDIKFISKNTGLSIKEIEEL